ncbi:BspA family leucine-rich repeat surface protein [Spiroplasma endosymbiont of Dasysyrphus albostriatus]|uniref:BspA family leucine-rich repeat surface protein n=1 Tax=Spiroplasma endosymbiont of Dasysyrphus albostriatus TaxID=3066299 RepID=UPI0030D60312
MTALSVLTFASAAGSLTVTVLNTSSQKNDVLNNKTQQDTIYIDENGKKVITNKHNLSYIKTTKITQIGFYKNDQGEIQVVNMPITIKEVPEQLPPEITSLSYMFIHTTSFNQDLSKWDVSNVTNMSWMFSAANAFNQNLSSWDTSNVTNMSYMFAGARKFNQDLSKWDVSNVTNMNNMFSNAWVFNQDLSKWNTSNVIDMSWMFLYAFLFNGDISSWDTSNVTNMNLMFAHALKFNQDLSKWNVSNVMKYESFSFDSGLHNSKKLPKFKKNF